MGNTVKISKLIFVNDEQNSDNDDRTVFHKI